MKTRFYEEIEIERNRRKMQRRQPHLIKRQVVLTENDIAKIINGEELKISFEGEEIIIRQSYAKDTLPDMLARKIRVMNTVSNTLKY